MAKEDTSPKPSQDEDSSSDDRRLDKLLQNWNKLAIPQRLVYLAVITGLVLTALGYLIPGDSKNDQARANLTLCAGIGITMMALGTQAIGVWKGIAMGGAAPVVLILYTLLPSPEAPPPMPTAKGLIHSLKLPNNQDFPSQGQVRIYDRGREILGCLDNGHTVYRFVIEDGEFDDMSPDLQMLDGGAVAKRARLQGGKLNAYLKSGRPLNLLFDPDNKKVYIPNAGPDGAHEEVNEPAQVGPDSAALDLEEYFPLGATTAFAGLGVGSIVDKLSNRNLEENTEAIEELKSSGAPSVSPLMDEFRSRESTAPRGNILSALLELFRSEPATRSSLVDEMTAADLDKVIKLLGDPDKSARSVATEFLIALNHPQAIDLLLHAAKDGPTLQQTNALVALENLLKDLPPERVSQITTDVKAMAANENDAAVKQRMSEFDEPVYFLVLASFSDARRAKQRAEDLRKKDYSGAEVYPLRANSYYVTTAFRERLRTLEARRTADIKAGKIAREAWAIRKTSLGERVFP